VLAAAGPRQRAAARTHPARARTPPGGPGAAGPRPRLWPPRRPGRGAGDAAVRGQRRRREAVPALAAGARHDGAGGRGHPAVPGGPHRRRRARVRGAPRHGPPVRRLRPGGRARRRAAPGRTHRRPHRAARLSARGDAEGPHRPLLGMIALLLAGVAQLAWASPAPGPGVGALPAAPAPAVETSPVAAGSGVPAMRAAQVQAAVNPLSVPQPDAGSGEALLLVEIPAGSATKFETRADGLVEVDRF